MGGLLIGLGVMVSALASAAAGASSLLAVIAVAQGIGHKGVGLEGGDGAATPHLVYE
jgi:hypothetical protein